MSQVFFDMASNFHPFDCDGPDECVHCDRAVTDQHDPETCSFCKDDVR